MCPINTTNRGRPPVGYESKSVERKIRIEPLVDEMLTSACRTLKISRSDAIRQGIILFLKEADKAIKSSYYE